MDFRTLLKEKLKNDQTGERGFEDMDIGGIFYLSIQASSMHASTPPALLDDVNAYETFQVILQTKQGVFICGNKGAWGHLASCEWMSLFAEESPILREADNVPVSVVQKIFEDVTASVEAHPESLVKKRACGVKLL